MVRLNVTVDGEVTVLAIVGATGTKKIKMNNLKGEFAVGGGGGVN